MTSIRRYKKKRRLKAEMNVVPYIDVMLVLLIIFMVSAPLMNQGINVKLPNADAKSLEQDQNEPMIISMSDSGQLFFNLASEPREAIDIKELIEQVKDNLFVNPEQQVFIQADKGMQYDKVVELMAQLQSSNVQNIGLVTQPKSQSSQ